MSYSSELNYNKLFIRYIINTISEENRLKKLMNTVI